MEFIAETFSTLYSPFRVLRDKPDEVATPVRSMPATDLIPGTRRSKRKRAEVSYLEDVDNEEHGEAVVDIDKLFDVEEDEDEDCFVPGKRIKMSKKKPTRTIKPKETKPFQFMSLPPEIRNMIYEMALWDSNSCLVSARPKLGSDSFHRQITRRSNSEVKWQESRWDGRRRFCRTNYRIRSTPSKDGKIPLLAINLLLANKQVYDEAIGILYNQPIYVDGTRTLHYFLANIGNNRQLVSNIVIQSWDESSRIKPIYECMTLLSTCTNLKTIFFDCTISPRERPEILARLMVKRCHVFFYAISNALGKRDAVLDIMRIHPSNFECPDEAGRQVNYYNPRFQTEEDLDKPVASSVKRRFETEVRKLLRGRSDIDIFPFPEV